MVMVVIVQEEFMVFLFLEMIAHDGGQKLDELFYFPLGKTGNERFKKLVPAKELEEYLE